MAYILSTLIDTRYLSSQYLFSQRGSIGTEPGKREELVVVCIQGLQCLF